MGSPGSIFLLTPSSPAARIAAKPRYGLQEGSGDLNSSLVLKPRPLGTLMREDRFGPDQPM